MYICDISMILLVVKVVYTALNVYIAWYHVDRKDQNKIWNLNHLTSFNFNVYFALQMFYFSKT